MKNPLGRIGRLFHQLVDVDYKIIHIDGHLNYLADFLSRAQCSCIYVAANTTSLDSTLDWSVEQAKDEEIREVIRCFKTRAGDEEWKKIGGKEAVSSWLRERSNLFFFNNILKYGANRIVVPEHLKAKILKWYHDSPFAGHRAFEITLYNIKFRFFWLFLSRDTKDYCRTCDLCQKLNFSNLIGRAPMKSIITNRRNQIFGLYFMGPFKPTKNGNMYILLAIDFYSKYVEGVATQTFDALVSAIFLFNQIICKHGLIEYILTYQGRNFEAYLFKHLCKLVGAEKVRTSSYHAQANGETERVNKVVKPDLAKYV